MPRKAADPSGRAVPYTIRLAPAVISRLDALASAQGVKPKQAAQAAVIAATGPVVHIRAPILALLSRLAEGNAHRLGCADCRLIGMHSPTCELAACLDLVRE